VGPINGHVAVSDPGTAMRQALAEMIDLSVADPDRDGKLFADGLRSLISRFGDDMGSPS
jgi:hypothetical protein